jgi:hypothetical protein
VRIQSLDLVFELRDLAGHCRTGVVTVYPPQFCLQFSNSDINCFLFGPLNFVKLLVDILLLDIDSRFVAFVHFLFIFLICFC